LQNVSKVLQESDFDEFMGYDQNYGPDEEPGDPLIEVTVIEDEVVVS